MRLIDADALKEDVQLHDRYVRSPMITSVLLHMIGNQPTVEAEPVKQDTELSIILQDYGIKDTDALRYILDQYQKIIVDITGGQMSYLTYPAETVIACADDNYRKCHEESVKHGRWINIKVSTTGESSAECSECGAIVHTTFTSTVNYCPNCGAKMKGERQK